MEENTIEKVLQSDEHLIWQGKPEKFKTLDKTYKNVFKRRIIIGSVTAVAIIALYIFMIVQNNADFKPFIPIMVVLLCALGPISIINYAGKLRNTVYAASNKRLIVCSSDIKSTDYDMIESACFKTDDDGHTTLLCGGAVDSKPSLWRVACLFGQNDMEAKDGPVCERFAFYALENPEELRETLAPYLKID